jgi:hypothetical protein
MVEVDVEKSGRLLVNKNDNYFPQLMFEVELIDLH